MHLKILYYFGFKITSLTEHTVLKLTNQIMIIMIAKGFDDSVLLPTRKVIFGVPQRSSLSPIEVYILFCIYLLPLSKLIKSFPSVKYNIYADDIEIHADYYQSSNIHLQSCLTTINNWLINNYSYDKYIYY